MESFEKMFEESLKSIKEGTTIEGEVISVVDGEIFVNLGYKADGIISRNDFSYDESKRPEDVYKAGDKIEVYVVKLNDGRGNVLLSTKKLESGKNKEEFEDAVANNKVLEAKVSEIMEKGVRVNFKGIKVFIPLSQLVGNNTNEYGGKTIRFKVIENEKNRVIGSERIVNKEERTKLASETMAKIQEGDIVKGTVKRINEYGAFVDIGGVEGLLHVSQMTWKRNADPKDIVSEGQQIDVEIIAIDRENNKISLKSKKDDQNPWNKIGSVYEVGSVVEVKVLKIVPFGVFVEIEQGLEGFIHISQIAMERIQSPKDKLSLNQIVEAKITQIDVENKKVELSIKVLQEKEEVKQEEATTEETVENN